MADNFGSFSFLVEHENTPWHGTIQIPSNHHENCTFKCRSYADPYSILPFSDLETYQKQSQSAWLDLGRPITLIESFVNSFGGGNLREGSRMTAEVEGIVSDILFDMHIDAHEKCITSFGITSDTITNLFHHQTVSAKMIQTDNDPPRCSRALYEYDITPTIKMQLTAMYERDVFDRNKLTRVPVKFTSDKPLDIFEVRRLLRKTLFISDYLAGYSEGEYFAYINGNHHHTYNFRIQTGKRRKKGIRQTVSTKAPNFGDIFANALRLSDDDPRSRNINCVLFALEGSMNVFEKFIRLFAYIEPVLRQRYETPSEPAQHRYIAGIEGYNAFLENAPDEVKNFAKEFAKPNYPNRKSLKYLLEAAITECRDFGMTIKPDYWNEIIDLRNEVFHGVDRNDKDWIRQPTHKIRSTALPTPV